MSKMMREHYDDGASFHKNAAEHHADIATLHHKIAKATDGEVSKHHNAISILHENLAKVHAKRAANYMEMSDCEKAAGAEDLHKLRPIDDLRVVIPAAPTAAEQVYGTDGLVPVMRAGQPPMGTHAPVPLEFEHLIKTENLDD